MIAKAIDKITEMFGKSMERRDIAIAGKNFIQSMGHTFSDRPDLPEPISLSTLSSLVQYIKSENDSLVEKKIIRIQSPTHVVLHGEVFSPYMLRQTAAEVRPCLPESFPFGRFMPCEEFIINLQSKFVPNEGDWENVALACAGIKKDDGMSYKDDGISQTVTVKSGVSLSTTKPLPNPVILAPYRTFPEISQPLSSFVLRVTDGRNGIPEVALFEADGGAWKLAAMKGIEEWLSNALGYTPVLILA